MFHLRNIFSIHTSLCFTSSLMSVFVCCCVVIRVMRSIDSVSQSKFTTLYFRDFSTVAKYAKVNRTRKNIGLQYSDPNLPLKSIKE